MYLFSQGRVSRRGLTDLGFFSHSRRRLRKGPWGSERKLLSERRMWTACAHSHTHSGEAEGECEIQIQGKGVDGTKHYIDRVRIVVTSTCTW